MKWTAPSDSGGLPVEYVVEMNPPSGKGDTNVASPSTSDVSFCCFEMCSLEWSLLLVNLYSCSPIHSPTHLMCV